MRVAPDIALMKMKNQVKSFDSYIRPICLPNKDDEDTPICPDNSRSGCVTVAGWGVQYNHKRLVEGSEGGQCMTDTSALSPDKLS